MSMSMFSFRSDLGPDEMTKNFATMTDWMGADGDKLVPFMTQSASAAVVATSFGLGMASHMTGAMLGMFEGMMSVSMKAAQGEAGSLAAQYARAKTEPVVDMAVTDAKASNVVSIKSAKKIRKTKSIAAKAVGAEKPTPEIKAPAVTMPVIDTPAKAASLAANAELAKLITALEPEDFRRPAEVEKPSQTDDLKMISGVGPKLEKVLNSLGIWTFDQVAKWTPNEIAWVDDYLQFKGRIDRDDWTAQAAALAAGGREEYLRVFGKEPR